MTELKILGIDEAGKGPVCGPLVICGYMIDEKNLEKLQKEGAKDSKMLTDEKRRKLKPVLEKMARDIALLSVSAKEIDSLRSISNLNKIEIERMQQIINLLSPDKAIIDAIEANTSKFHKKIESGLKIDCELITENFADKNYPVVGAASIIAKVHRDSAIEKLHEKFGYFGTGYCSDERTINFLKNWIKKNKEFPDFVRKSWITIAEIKAEKEQKKMGEYLGYKSKI